jgi:hypothetical protein
LRERSDGDCRVSELYAHCAAADPDWHTLLQLDDVDPPPRPSWTRHIHGQEIAAKGALVGSEKPEFGAAEEQLTGEFVLVSLEREGVKSERRFGLRGFRRLLHEFAEKVSPRYGAAGELDGKRETERHDGPEVEGGKI